MMVALLAARISAQTSQPTVKEHIDHNALLKLAWQIGCQAETFKSITFFEMIEILHPLVIHHIELAPGQILSKEHPEAIGPEMSQGDLDLLMGKLQSVKMDVVSYGVANFSNDESKARKVFEFSVKLKVKNIVADASSDSLEMLDKLAQNYRINVAILNGPSTSAWSNPEVLAKALTGRSNRIGVCADVANWRRAGFSPAESIQKFPGRVIEIRLSDVSSQGKEVVLGAGDSQAAESLTWLKHQNFKGVCAVQFTSGSDGQERLNNWVISANAFSDIVVKLAAEK
jgi:sugar phosphate isomerase/epimerase